MTGAAVMVVDDQAQVRRALDRLLQLEGYECQTAGSVGEARSLMERWTPELVLCDIDMPGGSGLELVDWLAQQHPDTAILMVTACDDPVVADQVLRSGADGYVIKPFARNEIVINVGNVLHRRTIESAERAHQAALERQVHDRTTELHRSLADLERTSASLDRSYEETVWRLACAAEYRDPETASHLERMSRYSELLARRAGYDDAWCTLVRLASPMHDVGKLGIPDEILLNPGRFTDAERAVMQTHASIGHQILSGSTSPLLQLAATIAHTHHEWWDGSGYPRGLSGTEIPVEGRIVAIADVFDALTTQRRYKEAMTFDAARDLMVSEGGRHFDPALLEQFFDSRSEIEEIEAAHREGA